MWYLILKPAFSSLGLPLNNTKVEVQGAKDAKEWPYKFCLSVSLDGSRFFQLETPESSCLVSNRGASK